MLPGPLVAGRCRAKATSKIDPPGAALPDAILLPLLPTLVVIEDQLEGPKYSQAEKVQKSSLSSHSEPVQIGLMKVGNNSNARV